MIVHHVDAKRWRTTKLPQAARLACCITMKGSRPGDHKRTRRRMNSPPVKINVSGFVAQIDCPKVTTASATGAGTSN